MIDHGIMALEGEQLKTVLTRAAAAAAITVSRKGAQPPYRHELKK
jgi:fructokinase